MFFYGRSERFQLFRVFQHGVYFIKMYQFLRHHLAGGARDDVDGAAPERHTAEERVARERDERDSNRAVAPLKPAADAIVLDTSALDRDGAFAAAAGATVAEKQRPAATSAALPADEPPLVRVWSQGFKVGPLSVVWLPPEKQRLSQSDLPAISPPASRMRVTSVASISGT